MSGKIPDMVCFSSIEISEPIINGKSVTTNIVLHKIDGDESALLSGKFRYPRQFEIHLPGNHNTHCNVNCSHCQGNRYIKDLAHWEPDALDLLNKLKGGIPYHIYGGAYTEPLLNPYSMAFLSTTKKYENHFGIHTNGTLLNSLEADQGWLTELNRISIDKDDYLSISIDAGDANSWAKVKNTKRVYLFDEIISGMEKACKIRRNNNSNGHAIRLVYLITPDSDSFKSISSIVSIAHEFGVDSLRFSIPYAIYNQPFCDVRRYRDTVEKPFHEKCEKMIKPFLADEPHIFYVSPESTNVDKYDFDKCFYYLYQITYGSDGYVYKCSSVAAPTAKQCRVGKITSDLDEFENILRKNANLDWDCKKMCFEKGLRCNRQALEINRILNEKYNG